MSTVFLAHVSVFALSALACLAALPRAMRVGHPETRKGLVGLLLTVALWAGGYVGYLVAPGEALKTASYIVGFVSALLAVGAWLYFCAAYTGRSPRRAPYRWAVVGVFAATSLLKVTNPLHELYFTTAWVSEPFPHLAVRHELLYWAVLGLSYAVIAVGFFMLLEQFYYAGADSRPLVALVAVTAIPTAATVFGGELSWLLPLMYEPPGVALFAVGTLFVYVRRFEAIRFAAESDDAAIFLDQSGRIRDYNRAARLLFPSLRGAIGEPLDSVLPQLTVDRETDGVIAVEGETDGVIAVEGETDGVIAVEGETDGKTGASSRTTRFFHVSRNAFTAGGATSGELLTVDDVTDREQYRAQLEDRTEQLEALNRVVRHDIRNDMAVIHGWSETLRDHVDDEGRDALERVLRKSAHVIELTETARDFVDSLTGDAVLEAKPVDLGTVLTTEVQVARDSFPDATVRVAGDPPDVAVLANEMLASVFRNLLNNAVQHNDTDGLRIETAVETAADTVQIRIADNGVGIEDDRKKSVFRRGETSHAKETGSGFGLFFVDVMIEKYGGDVRIEDSDAGGACFVIELSTEGELR